MLNNLSESESYHLAAKADAGKLKKKANTSKSKKR